MINITRDVNGNFDEIWKIIDLLSAIENGNLSHQGAITTAPVIKSSVIIALYNIVEATTTKLLRKIHSEIISSNLTYKKLERKIQNIVILYYHYHKSGSNNIHESLDVIHDTMNIVVNKGFFNIQYDEMSKVYQLYSGNLDARSIRKVFLKYGIEIPTNIGSCLKSIRDGRNILAHGEKAFEEYGRDLFLNELIRKFNDTRDFISKLITLVFQYIAGKKYKVTTVHPSRR